MAGLNHKKASLEEIRHYRKELFGKSVQSILASEKIEDAAESFWVVYRGRRNGNFGTVGVISLNRNDILETEMRESDCKKLIKMAA